MVLLLRDSMSSGVDAVILTRETTVDDVQEIIYNVKENNDEWQFDDIVDALPGDCDVYAAWSNDFNNVWY